MSLNWDQVRWEDVSDKVEKKAENKKSNDVKSENNSITITPEKSSDRKIV